MAVPSAYFGSMLPQSRPGSSARNSLVRQGSASTSSMITRVSWSPGPSDPRPIRNIFVELDSYDFYDKDREVRSSRGVVRRSPHLNPHMGRRVPPVEPQLGVGTSGLGERVCLDVAAIQRKHAIEAQEERSAARRERDASRPPPPEPENPLHAYWRRRNEMIGAIREEKEASKKLMATCREEAKQEEQRRQDALKNAREAAVNRKAALRSSQADYVEAAARLNALEFVRSRRDKEANRVEREMALQRKVAHHKVQREQDHDEHVRARHQHLDRRHREAQGLRKSVERLVGRHRQHLKKEVEEKAVETADLRRVRKEAVVMSVNNMFDKKVKQGEVAKALSRQLRDVVQQRRPSTAPLGAIGGQPGQVTGPRAGEASRGTSPQQAPGEKTLDPLQATVSSQLGASSPDV